MDRRNKSYDDFVYEEEYYDTYYQEENLEDDSIIESESEESDSTIYTICICEECNHRWDLVIDENNDELDNSKFCPLCGSSTIIVM